MATVLIVEDDPANILVFSKILKKRAGLDVQATEDVEEVLRSVQSSQVDLILMDVGLSRSSYQGKSIDGIKLTQIIKADANTAKIPIILVTAHAMRGDRESFLSQSGANDYISKPVVDQQAFVDKILSLLPSR